MTGAGPGAGPRVLVASTGIRRRDWAGTPASGTGFSPPDRGHYNARIGSATTAARGSAETAVVGSSNRAEDRSGRDAGGAATTPTSIDELSRLDHREFVDNAYLTLLGRPPTAAEHEDFLGALLSGDAKSWLLGRLRYGAEGRARAVPVRGLRAKYLAQRLFRTPILGRLLAWLGAVASLPRSLRYLRGFAQSVAGERIHAEHARALVSGQVDAASARITHLDWRVAGAAIAQLERDWMRGSRISTGSCRPDRAASARSCSAKFRDRAAQLDAQLRDRIAQLDAERRSAIGMLERDLARVTRIAGDAKLRIEALSPPHLAETFEVIGGALVEPARDRARVRTDIPASELSEHERYAVFEAAFYDSTLVAAKQRVYLRYLDRALALRQPFLDLGCGRGEFLGILAGAGITPVGVDVNPTAFAGLRTAGFEVVEQDLLAYLQAERRMFSGASALQVVEHLTAGEIEQMLALVAQRLLPGALLIVETPNPLCPFALGQFNTDPTHVAPLPPERLRFAIEAAGFEATRTLFQARAPGAPFAGPDPRAYYMDYAIIAYRSAT